MSIIYPLPDWEPLPSLGVVSRVRDVDLGLARFQTLVGRRNTTLSKDFNHFLSDFLVVNEGFHCGTVSP